MIQQSTKPEDLWAMRAQVKKAVTRLFIKAQSGKIDRGQFWEVIQEIEALFRTINPYEYKVLLEDIERERRSQTNKHAAGKDGLRQLGRVPVFIWGTVKAFYGEEMPYSNKRFQREFIKRFPHYRISEKV